MLPGVAGLKGAGPDDDDPARSHGLGGGPLPEFEREILNDQ